MTTETPKEVEFLSDVEMDLIFFVERFHASTGSAPTDEQVKQRFGVTNETLETFKANPLVLRSFNTRGIIYPAPEDTFTAEQMHAAAVMMDPIDRRSDEKKLRDMGIGTRKWSTWLHDEKFAAYLRDRSEILLKNSLHEAHKGLIKGARNGNVASIKALYEITGRHDPSKESQVDVQMILHTFIEVIQRYVKDPVMLHAIAMDLSQVASAETYSSSIANNMINNRRTVQGSVTQSQLSAPPPLEDLDG